MKKIYLSVVCLLISIPLIAQLYVEPEKEVECSVFLAKEGREMCIRDRCLAAHCHTIYMEVLLVWAGKVSLSPYSSMVSGNNFHASPKV